MEYMSNKLAVYVHSQISDPQISVESYQYGFQILMEMLLGFLANGCIAIYLNMKWECFIFMCVFFVLRSFAGGFHMNTFRQCFVVSTILTYFTLLAVKYTNVSYGISGMIMVLSTLFLSVVQAAEHENRTVTKEEDSFFKKRLIQSLVGVVLLFLTFAVCQKSHYAFLVSLTTALTAVLMLLAIEKNKHKKTRLGL